MATKHYLLTEDGCIKEFSEQEAAQVASGATPLPRYADKRLRYVQVAFEDSREQRHAQDGELRVYTLGATIRFDGEGRLVEAGAPEGDDGAINEFEQDACVRFALRDTLPGHYVLN